jgi:CelD/BcsL family acetyltransferase involved in cellulose biosynthesis
VKLEIHTDPAAFDVMAGEWTSLLTTAQHNSIFHTPQWMATCWKAFDRGELCLMTAREGSELVGVVPLAIEREGARQIARFASYLEVTDYQDIVARPGRELDVWRLAMAHIAAQPWQMDLHNIPAGSPTMAFFNELAQGDVWTVTTGVDDVCPIISPLPADFETDRHELRRKLRRLLGNSDAGIEVSWEFADLTQAMDDFVRLHKLSSADKEQFMTPRMVGFFDDLARMCSDHGWLRLGFITAQSQPVSTIMAFEYGDWFGLYNSGYDPAYEYLSVGLLLKALAVEYAIKAGKTCYDFLQGSERYKYDLGGKDTEVCFAQCARR